MNLATLWTLTDVHGIMGGRTTFGTSCGLQCGVVATGPASTPANAASMSKLSHRSLQ